MESPLTIDGDLRISDIAALMKHVCRPASYKPALKGYHAVRNASGNAANRNPAP